MSSFQVYGTSPIEQLFSIWEVSAYFWQDNRPSNIVYEQDA